MDKKAFTLVETLVAVAVFSLVLLVVYTFYSKFQVDVAEDTDLNFFLTDYVKFLNQYQKDLDKAKLNIPFSEIANFSTLFDPYKFQIEEKGVLEWVEYKIDRGKLYRIFKGNKRLLIGKNLHKCNVKAFSLLYAVGGVPKFQVGVKTELIYKSNAAKKTKKEFKHLFFLNKKFKQLVVNKLWLD